MTATGLPSGGEEARSFHQERLAFFTRTLLVILVGFYLAGNLAASAFPSFAIGKWLVANWFAKGANPAMLASFTFLAAVGLVLRAPRPPRTLALLDATVLLVTTTIFGSMALSPYVEDAPRDPVFRTAMAVMMTVTFRAVIVPSSAGRTLLLSFLAVPIPLALSALVYAREGQGPAHVAAHVVWTGSWHVAAAVLAGVTSRIIYGLRREVREAQQLGQYTLGEKIGEGGMGAVYHARHALLRRPTAIKLLTAARGGEARAVRFEREAQLTSGLKHPNTVAIFDYGRTADGVFYYAMEYLDGLNLDDLVRADGAQPAARVVHVLRQVAGALVEAHGVGLIHRDIKPANVILLPEYRAALDVAKVVDFGLVKELADGGDLTQDQIAGTPMYLSPEAIREPRPRGRAQRHLLARPPRLLPGGGTAGVRRAQRGGDLRPPPAHEAHPSRREVGRSRAAQARGATLGLPREGAGGAPGQRARAHRPPRRLRRRRRLDGRRRESLVAAPPARRIPLASG